MISDASAVGQSTYVGALIDSLVPQRVKDSPELVERVLCNWGANDASFLPGGGGSPQLVEATWVAQYVSILDYLHGRFPNAHIWIMRPWRANLPTQSATLHGWIDSVQAARPTFTSLGPDEAVWLEGGDNGATNTTDGVHYSAAGNTACASEWATALGY